MRLALGVPVVATKAPPLLDLIASGAIHEACSDTLKDVIVSIKGDRDNNASHSSAGQNNQERRNFLSELGMSVNRNRLNQAIEEAVATHLETVEAAGTVVSLFSSKSANEAGGDLPHAMAEMVDTVRTHYKGLRGDVLRVARERRGEQSVEPVKSGNLNPFQENSCVDPSSRRQL